MSRFNDEDRDEDLRREAIDERRARLNGCRCGNPDLPGICPGWRNCPMNGEDATFIDIADVTEYGLTQRLSAAVRVF